MDDERVRWGRKYLKFRRIVLSIRLVGYNSCVLCCSVLLMEWTGFNRRHWSIESCHLTYTREASLLFWTCSVKWYLRPLESLSMIFFSRFEFGHPDQNILFEIWKWSRNMLVALDRFRREFLRVINNETEFLRIYLPFNRLNALIIRNDAGGEKRQKRSMKNACRNSFGLKLIWLSAGS